MSHSPDFASWRWMNWLRCSSADSGNSSSLARRPFDAFCWLNSLTDSIWAPDVSLPVQYVTLPFASLDAASVGAFFAPSVAPVASPVAPPPPPPSSSSPPQAAPNSAIDTASAAAKPLRTVIRLLLLLVRADVNRDHVTQACTRPRGVREHTPPPATTRTVPLRQSHPARRSRTYS